MHYPSPGLYKLVVDETLFLYFWVRKQTQETLISCNDAFNETFRNKSVPVPLTSSYYSKASQKAAV